MGDFNAIRDVSEIKGGSEDARMEEIETFNNFLLEAELADLLLLRRRFTWSRPGGSMMSQLDIFLISDKWIRTWPKSTQWCLDK